MRRIIPFLCVSLVLHGCAFVTLANLVLAPPGVVGSLDGDPDRVFVCVVSDEEEVTATAPVPSPVDSAAAEESKKIPEPEIPEPTPEVIAKHEPDEAADFLTEPVEDAPEPEPREEEPEKEIEKEQEESHASTPQVASDIQKNLPRWVETCGIFTL